MKIGDKVRVVNYGHLIWSREVLTFKLYNKSTNGIFVYDINPEIIGKEGVISTVSSDGKSFAIEGIKGKHAWYNKKQLKIVK